MGSLKDKFEQNIPKIEFLEERFKFIENKTLRTNLSISFQYVIFLITLEEEVTLQGPVSYSIFKNIVLNTASIIEGSLHYLLDTLIKQKQIDSEKIMSKEDIYSNKKVLYTTDDGIEICGVHFKKKSAKLKTNTNFIEINRACKRAKILNDELFEEVDSLAIKLAEVFPEKTRDEWERDLRVGKAAKNQYFHIKRKVKYKEIQLVRKFPILRESQYKGGYIEEKQSERKLPYGLLARRTLGSKRVDALPVGLEGELKMISRVFSFREFCNSLAVIL